MKCVYRKRMGDFNPVCENVGVIRKIIPNYPPMRDTFSNILKIETEEFPFWCDTKYFYVKNGGYCKFHPQRDSNEETKFINLYGLHDGDTIDVKPNAVYFNRQEYMSPITTDPRVLCIMHKSNDLTLHPTEAQLIALCEHIPTWDEATAYLKKIGALMDCVSEEEMYRNMKREEK